jgi:hypothetical protein
MTEDLHGHSNHAVEWNSQAMEIHQSQSRRRSGGVHVAVILNSHLKAQYVD